MDSTLESIQSIALQSEISLLSVASLSTVGQNQPGTSAESVSMTSAPKASETSSQTSIVHPVNGTPKPSQPSSTVSKGPPTSVHTNSGSPKGGIPPPVVAIIVVFFVAAAIVGGWFFYQWRKNHQTRAKSGLWLESGKYLDQIKKQSNEGKVTSPYAFGGMGNSGPLRENFGPGSDHPPTPPAKDLGNRTSSSTGMEQFAPVSPPAVISSSSSPDPFARVTPNVLPRLPSVAKAAASAHARSPSPSSLPPPSSPYVPRPDSGPVLLYSTPKSQDVSPVPETEMRAVSPSLSVPAPVAKSRPPSYVSNGSDMASPPSSPPESPLATPALAPIKPLVTPRSLQPAVFHQSQRPPSPTATPQRPLTDPLTEPHPIYRVIRIYVPTLLDELKVNVGDLVRVTTEFDDGWAHCEKVGDEDGAAGVVPLECLDRNTEMDVEVGPMPTNLSLPVGLEAPPLLPRRSSRYSSFKVDFDSVRTSLG